MSFKNRQIDIGNKFLFLCDFHSFDFQPLFIPEILCCDYLLNSFEITIFVNNLHVFEIQLFVDQWKTFVFQNSF